MNGHSPQTSACRSVNAEVRVQAMTERKAFMAFVFTSTLSNIDKVNVFNNLMEKPRSHTTAFLPTSKTNKNICTFRSPIS